MLESARAKCNAKRYFYVEKVFKQPVLVLPNVMSDRSTRQQAGRRELTTTPTPTLTLLPPAAARDRLQAIVLTPLSHVHIMTLKTIYCVRGLKASRQDSCVLTSNKSRCLSLVNSHFFRPAPTHVPFALAPTPPPLAVHT